MVLLGISFLIRSRNWTSLNPSRTSQMKKKDPRPSGGATSRRPVAVARGSRPRPRPPPAAVAVAAVRGGRRLHRPRPPHGTAWRGAISRVHPALGPGATTRRRVLPPRAPHQRLLHRRHALRRRRALQSPPPTRPLSSRCWDRSDATSATFAARNRKPNCHWNGHHCWALWDVLSIV